MLVHHEEFGEGQIINSTEVLDEEGHFLTVDVMFEHGIETAVDANALTVLDEEDKFAGLSPQFRAAAQRGTQRANTRYAGAGNRQKFNAYPKLKLHWDPPKKTNEEVEQVDEATYSAKAAVAGKDLGKPGKNFAKIADDAAKKYGSKKSGEKVAGAILAKIRAKHVKEEIEEVDEALKGDQDKIDANKNGKVDADDFKKLRSKKDDGDCMKESVEPKVTPATASLRPSAGAVSIIHKIMGENRDVRKEAAIKEFQSRKK